MISRISTYLKETRQELKKVNWPTRKEATRSTILVIIISVAVSLYTGLFDYLFKTLLEQLLF